MAKVKRFREFKPKESTRKRGVVYFSHVPHGFYEKEMRQFFTQFGKVTNINIPLSSVNICCTYINLFIPSLFEILQY